MVNRFFNLFGGATEAVGRYCAGEGDYGTRLAFGDCQIHDPLDLEAHTNLFLIWGRNPAVTNIHMMPVLKNARARGAVAIVIDPVRTKTVRYATTRCNAAGRDGFLPRHGQDPLEQRPVDLDRLHAIGERTAAISTWSARSRSTPSRPAPTWTERPSSGSRSSTSPQARDDPRARLQSHAGHQTFQSRRVGVLSGNVGIPRRRQPHQLAVARDPQPNCSPRRRGRCPRRACRSPTSPPR